MRNLSLAALAALCTILAPPSLAGQELENSDYIHVVDQADRGEMVFMIGPLDLPASQGHGSHSHTKGIPLQVVTFPRGGWIQGFLSDMVDSKGTPLRETFLHHVNVIDPDHRELFSAISQRIMAAGPETGKKELPQSMGLPVKEGQRLLVRAVFHNPSAVDYHGLYLRIRFDFTPSRAGEGLAGVFPVYMDVRPPVGRKDFDLAPGVSTQSWEGSPAVSGRLLAAGGHMHQYGKSLALEDVTDEKVLWRVEPRTDAQGNIQSIPIGSFWKKGGVPMRSDHVYRLTVTYDNPTGEPIEKGGMGTLGGVFIPDPGERWPEVAKEDPQYLADLKYTRGGGGDRQSKMDQMSDMEPTQAVEPAASQPVQSVTEKAAEPMDRMEHDHSQGTNP
jgi:hypothetical protein